MKAFTPSLFDTVPSELPVELPHPDEPIVDQPIATWNEVPQALFLSWSPAMQHAYCRNRDLNSAQSAHERGEDQQFYLTRADGYRQMMESVHAV